MKKSICMKIVSVMLIATLIISAFAFAPYAAAYVTDAPPGLDYEIWVLTGVYDQKEIFGDEWDIQVDILFVYEYPVFKGNSVVAQKINSIYNGVVADLKMKYPGAENKPAYEGYKYDEYLLSIADELWDIFVDVTICFIYSREDVISISQKTSWCMGGVFDTVYKAHSFNASTGAELEITDILTGTKANILRLLQREYETEFEPLMDETGEDMEYFLSNEGLHYFPKNHFGFQRGQVLTIPYSRAELFNPSLFRGVSQNPIAGQTSGQPGGQTGGTPSTWAAPYVNRALYLELVPGPLQSSYTQDTTRAEFCALAVTLYEQLKGPITERMTFADTNDLNVQKAAAIGVVQGVGDNKFNPGGKLNREQAATMLARLAGAAGQPMAKTVATFSDVNTISTWAKEGVGQVQGARIMEGVGDNTFAPKRPYTREQSIITILRMYDALSGAQPELTGVQWGFDAAYNPSKAVTASQLVSLYNLTAAERRLHDQIADAINNLDMEIAVDLDPNNEADRAMLRKVYYTVYNTHPEFFWMRQIYTFSRTAKAGGGKHYVYPLYLIDGYDLRAASNTDGTVFFPSSSEISSAKAWIERGKTAIRRRLNDLPIHNKMTQIELQMAVYGWMCENLTYVNAKYGTAEENQSVRSIHGALIGEGPNCDGFARTFQYIMGLLGIECIRFSGLAPGEGSHAWNAIKLGDSWYQMDVTFDCSFTTNNNVPSYYWHNRTDRFMAEQGYTYGYPDSPGINPNLSSTATTYNYFVMTDSIITSDADFISKVPKLIANARASGEWGFDILFASSYASPSEFGAKMKLLDSSVWGSIKYFWINSRGQIYVVFS